MKGCAVSVDRKERNGEGTATAIYFFVFSRISMQNAITKLEFSVKLVKINNTYTVLTLNI